MITTIYGCGLRINEILSIKYEDIPRNNIKGYIKIFGKGNKERLIPLIPIVMKTINEYINFISLILYKYKKEFYISKNNNNLLRIESIAEAFPNSLFLVPFRDPFQQAYSLLTQHKNFINLQTEDKFVKNYMTYLVHHEFGIDHRPYDFGTKNKIETLFFLIG